MVRASIFIWEVVRLRYSNTIRLAPNVAAANTITHNGRRWHADDLMGCVIIAAFLEPNHEDVVLLRTRDRDIIERKRGHAVIFDVGYQYDPTYLSFDHHQSEFQMRRTRLPYIKYASAGLLWLEYGREILKNNYECPEDLLEEVMDSVDRLCIEGIDMVDNGKHNYSYSTLTVSGLLAMGNPLWDEKDAFSDERFVETANWARWILDRAIMICLSIARGRKLVGELLQDTDAETEIMVFDQFIGGWESAIARSPEESSNLKFVIYKDQKQNRTDKDMWTIEAIVDRSKPTGYRMLFPENWWGLNERHFKKETGIRDAAYINKVGTLATARSEEGAIQLANLAIKLRKMEIMNDYDSPEIVVNERVQDDHSRDRVTAV